MLHFRYAVRTDNDWLIGVNHFYWGTFNQAKLYIRESDAKKAADRWNSRILRYPTATGLLPARVQKVTVGLHYGND